MAWLKIDIIIIYILLFPLINIVCVLYQTFYAIVTNTFFHIMYCLQSQYLGVANCDWNLYIYIIIADSRTSVYCRIAVFMYINGSDEKLSTSVVVMSTAITL